MPIETIHNPVRFVMLGGFLGAGKTTALLRLARHYSARGLRVGVITNDQAEGLVDTQAFQSAGFPTEEIPSGCFCCHFEKLLEASGRLEGSIAPDILLAEPVGSCTDLVNAVIAPLKALYRDRFTVAPYAVLADPERVLESLSGTGPAGFSRKVTYLYTMQQNEADIIALNKVDRLSAAELERVMALLRRNFPRASHLPVSALTGAGFDALIAAIDRDEEPGLHPANVDYARYTEGEVALGWLNARVRFSSSDAWDGDAMLEELGRRIHGGLLAVGAEVAHFKMRMKDRDGREAAVHSTNNREACEVRMRIGGPVTACDVVINVRAEAEPASIGRAVLETLAALAVERGLAHEVVQCETFAPGAPVPPPASRLTVRL